jgi:putative FmdB family regulatory protein
MPFYEYECGACGHRLEALQKISDDPLVDCPECNEARLKKLISAAAFRLKGTGWYETDFKNGDNKKSGKDDKSAGESGGTKPDKAASDSAAPANADAGSAAESSKPKPTAANKDSGQGANA